MKHLKKFTIGLIVAIALMNLVAYAGYGDADDPFVTLSYITSIFKPSILSEVDSRIQAAKNDITQLGSGGANDFKVISVASGKTLIGDVGTEIMLRIGTATCVASSSPGLIDSSDAVILSGGGALKTNHLYMVTVEDRGFKATSDVKIVIRGTYTIS